MPRVVTCLQGKSITLLTSGGVGDFSFCPVKNEGSCCSTPLSVFTGVLLLDSVHVNSHEVYLTVDSHSLVVCDVGHLSESCRWYFLFREVPAKVFGPFLKFNHVFCSIDFSLLIFKTFHSAHFCFIFILFLLLL